MVLNQASVSGTDCYKLGDLRANSKMLFSLFMPEAISETHWAGTSEQVAEEK